jgi:hypothetical protein
MTKQRQGQYGSSVTCDVDTIAMTKQRLGAYNEGVTGCTAGTGSEQYKLTSLQVMKNGQHALVGPG